MKTEFIPYYLSRAVLSALFGWFMAVQITTWVGVLSGLMVFAGFLWYLHGGRYLVDPSHPLTPIRRDARGAAIRDRAVVIGVAVGALVYLGLFLLDLVIPLPANLGVWAILAGSLVYFAVSSWLFAQH